MGEKTKVYLKGFLSIQHSFSLKPTEGTGGSALHINTIQGTVENELLRMEYSTGSSEVGVQGFSTHSRRIKITSVVCCCISRTFH